MTSNHGIIAENPSVNSFLVTTAVYYYSVRHSNRSSSFMAIFIMNCSTDAGGRASQPWISGVCCVRDALGTRAGVGERCLLSPSGACDLQCLRSRFQQS